MSLLFAYGTLMCSEVIERVTGTTFVGTPGTLHGYGRYRVRGQAYPGLVLNEAGRVDGLIYQGVTPDAWARLDRFEGTLYERVRVEVEPGEGPVLEAQTYVVRGGALHRMTEEEWDYEEFVRRGKARFQSEYAGYQAIE